MKVTIYRIYHGNPRIDKQARYIVTHVLFSTAHEEVQALREQHIDAYVRQERIEVGS